MQPYRATRVDFVSGNTDFGTQPVLETVSKTGTGVHHHAGRIDLAQELARTGVIVGNDGVGMVVTLGVDVLDKVVDTDRDLDGKNGR